MSVEGKECRKDEVVNYMVLFVPMRGAIKVERCLISLVIRESYFLKHYQFLAYYYVSFARTMPSVLKEIGLPYDKAYETALNLYRSSHGDK